MNKQQNDQPQGLRFDIYERIHLTEEAAGIAELEEIELLPRIQVVTHGDHAALRGHLLLEGVYRTPEQITSELHHLIPVEITIPLNRVGRLEDISVEIENFDVDLLSLRSLNITGVLSLHGVESSHAEETAVWLDEEFTVVHAPEHPVQSHTADGEYRHAEAYSTNDSTSDYVTDPETSYRVPAQQESVSWEQLSEGHGEQKASSEQQGYESAVDPNRFYEPWTGKAVEDSSPEVKHEHGSPEVWGFQQEEAWTGGNEPKVSSASPNIVYDPLLNEPHLATESEVYLEPQLEESQVDNFDFRPEASEQVNHEARDTFTEDKPEMRVALNSKKDEGADEPDPVVYSSLLQSSRSVKEAEYQQQLEQEPQDQDQKAEEERENAKWKNLFFHTQDETPFRKVRLCIVQREDTLETIADRYQLSTRELQLYNRLAEHHVEEGQVLYIP
ncbi:LysM peptidoglycan-binding domain-containing protein [Paenibacillus peoriae]|uniref:LysM peptidoglycan-binding domain-containing protein n=1 Tax=Paenibacillus peoriae TaxID=59893 RepID=UPI00096D8499|nr:LysM peptidoglycan-binding domain-containing protein [Paenibacillus peoriae]OMF40651.1 peptidoglycan-binding protein [Paenibacillus peoriae]PPQ45772.1 LysM peptidoglycan-binding domain-containing protein [Paenibacillus peoriae]